MNDTPETKIVRKRGHDVVGTGTTTNLRGKLKQEESAGRIPVTRQDLSAPPPGQVTVRKKGK